VPCLQAVLGFGSDGSGAIRADLGLKRQRNATAAFSAAAIRYPVTAWERRARSRPRALRAAFVPHGSQ
jgi:hypothetical protein